jgi:lipid II:glycine glycyltransferase (peptidoglycan interpeptide bridge formation enzyme)
LIAEIIKNIDHVEYENFIKNNFSSFYHSKNHLSFLKDLLKIDPHFIQVKEKNEIVGLMPFFLKKSKHGLVINSLPFFGSYGGIVYKNDCTKLILNELNNFYLENDVLSSVIIPNPLLQNELIYENHFSYKFKDPRLIQCLDLTNKSEHQLWDSFEQRVRRAVRKSQKLNITVTNPELTNEVIDEFYKMHITEMQSKGGKIKPNNFFQKIKEHFIIHQDYEIFCAKNNENNLSYLLVFHHNDFTEYYMPAYTSESKNTQSTSLLIWNSIKSSLNRKINYYNFGGTWKNQPELYKFKRGWNSTDFTYNYYINCDLEKIKEIGIDEISKNYEFFYIVPFEQLC